MEDAGCLTSTSNSKRLPKRESRLLVTSIFLTSIGLTRSVRRSFDRYFRLQMFSMEIFEGEDYGLKVSIHPVYGWLIFRNKWDIQQGTKSRVE